MVFDGCGLTPNRKKAEELPVLNAQNIDDSKINDAIWRKALDTDESNSFD